MKRAAAAAVVMCGMLPLTARAGTWDLKLEVRDVWGQSGRRQVSRALALTALHTGDPDALELAKTMARDKLKDAKKVPTLFAVLYHLTGDEAYQKAVLEQGAGALSVGGYLYICDHWLLNQPPKPRPKVE